MEKSKFTINKSHAVEVYKIRHESGMYWADIVIDSNENSGRIFIASDFGDWQRYWGSCSGPFKEFLIGLDIHYAAGKFGADKEFDLPSTVLILEDHAADNFEEDNLKGIMDEIKNLNNCSNINEFMGIITQECPLIMEMENHSPDVCYMISPGFQRFWNELWPILLNEFKTEKIIT